MKKRKNEWQEQLRAARIEIPKRLGYSDGWTQFEMALLLGVQENYISMLERGERRPSKLFMTALNFAMELSAHGLDPRARNKILKI